MKAEIRSRRDSIRGMLADLKLPGALEAADGILGEADSGEIIVAMLDDEVTVQDSAVHEFDVAVHRLEVAADLGLHELHVGECAERPVTEEGERLMELLLDGSPRLPTAVFAHNDLMALGALKERQHIVIALAGQAHLPPLIVVARMAANIDHSVDA